MVRGTRTSAPAATVDVPDATRSSPHRRRRRPAVLAPLMLVLVALVLPPLGSSPLGAATPPASWQRQTLLAATDDEYLVLEVEGHKSGSVDVWTETLRLVRFDARTNERGDVTLVRVETWVEDEDGTRRTDVTRSSEASLGGVLDAFGGRLAPPPSIRLKRAFHVDGDGVHVFEGGEPVSVLTRDEIDARARRDPHGSAFEELAITALQQIGEQFYLTLRAGGPRVRRELVLRIPR